MSTTHLASDPDQERPGRFIPIESQVLEVLKTHRNDRLTVAQIAGQIPADHLGNPHMAEAVVRAVLHRLVTMRSLPICDSDDGYFLDPPRLHAEAAGS